MKQAADVDDEQEEDISESEGPMADLVEEDEQPLPNVSILESKLAGFKSFFGYADYLFSAGFSN